VEYFDNLGKSETVKIDFAPTIPGAGNSNEWTMTLRDSAQSGAVIGQYTLNFDDSRASGGTLLGVAAAGVGGAYNSATGSLIVNVDGGPIEVNIGRLGARDGMTQLGDKFLPLSTSKDGSPVGNMISAKVDENGFVHASFDTGATRIIYQVPLVDLPNPNGMISLDQQTYMPSADSGSFFLWNAGDGPTGDVVAFAREESATDVAGELTDMIQTQRAYSSNAKVIQTVDEMLQETTNIKR
jgi:flagellar hook protein FlgE